MLFPYSHEQCREQLKTHTHTNTIFSMNDIYPLFISSVNLTKLITKMFSAQRLLTLKALHRDRSNSRQNRDVSQWKTIQTSDFEGIQNTICNVIIQSNCWSRTKKCIFQMASDVTRTPEHWPKSFTLKRYHSSDDINTACSFSENPISNSHKSYKVCRRSDSACAVEQWVLKGDMIMTNINV